MNISPGKIRRRYVLGMRPPLVVQFRNQLIAFFFGVVFGLILSLWWRAAQINQVERDTESLKYFESEFATLER